MGLFSSILNVITRKQTDGLSLDTDYIFYKIVNFDEKINKYLIQCMNTKAVFALNIFEIILDIDILYGLHPIQSCYVGIEYALCTKKDHRSIICFDEKINEYHFFRYGSCNLISQSRNKHISFVDTTTKVIYTMDPRDIALSEQLISKFDAIQAFHIGIFSGLLMKHPDGVCKNQSYIYKPRLTLIKNEAGSE